MNPLLVATLAAHIVAAPVALIPDPCRLVTAAEITAALGKAPSGGEPSGPSLDEETGGQVTFCTRNVGNMVLVISVIEVADAARADGLMTTLAKREPADEDEAKMVPASGLGDRSLFGATKIGAHWVAQKGKFMVAISLAAELIDGTQHKESLKKLAAAALTRL